MSARHAYEQGLDVAASGSPSRARRNNFSTSSASPDQGGLPSASEVGVWKLITLALGTKRGQWTEDLRENVWV